MVNIDYNYKSKLTTTQTTLKQHSAHVKRLFMNISFQFCTMTLANWIKHDILKLQHIIATEP